MKKDKKTQQLQSRMLMETGMADDMLKNFNKGFIGLAQVEASRVRENEQAKELCPSCKCTLRYKVDKSKYCPNEFCPDRQSG